MATTYDLFAPGLRDYAGATLATFPTKAAALKEWRWANLGPEVAPVKVGNRFSVYWALWAVPLGDPGEVKTLLTEQRGWLKVCAVGCVYVRPGQRFCPGHAMSPQDALEYTVALCGHRTRVARILTDRRENRTDGTYDYVPAGTMCRGLCLCGWKTTRTEFRYWAVQEAGKHTAEHEPTPARA